MTTTTVVEMLKKIDPLDLFDLDVNVLDESTVIVFVTVVLRGQRYQASRGALLDLAVRLNLEGVDMHPHDYCVSGHYGATLVELCA